MKRSSSVLTKGKILPEDFFDRPALLVARDLLGKVLVRETEAGRIEGIITETEAYLGPHDLASHSSKGMTPRTKVMFGPPGRWYVYLNYGLHWMLNVVCRAPDLPAAVLLRGTHNVSGPGRLGKYFRITKEFNSVVIKKTSKLWIEDRGMVLPRILINRTPRIGVDYAGPLWSAKPYRFFVDMDKLTKHKDFNKMIGTMTFVSIAKSEKKSKKRPQGG